jgi:hypothetical protein
MKKQVQFTLLVLLFQIGAVSVIAQSKLSIDNVYSVTLRNSGTIIAKEQIKGYFFFYQSDKIDKRTNEYTLQIVDENLNKLKDIKFTDSKNILLLESSYNGDKLMFTFFDDDQNMLDYRIFAMDGKKMYNYSKVLDKKSEAYFKQSAAMNTAEESANQNVFDIENKGFISVTPLREDKKYTYEVNFYSSTRKKTWAYNPAEDGKFTGAQYLGATDSIALLEVMSKENLTSKHIESTILGLNLETGKKVFEMRTKDGAQQLYPMNLASLSGNSNFILVGPYYNGDDNVTKDESLGLGVWIMNNQGKLIRSKYISWATDMGKFLKISNKGNLANLGYVYFHRIVQTQDGRIFAIGEGYKKNANAAGIAMSILTQSYSSNFTKLVITDMLLLELNDKFELLNAKVLEKNNNTFALPGSDFATPHTLAVIAKAYGAFDYTFTQLGDNKESFVSGYTDFEKSKNYKGLVFHSISYYDGKVTNDQINLKTDASSLRLMPAKPGSVLLVEYFKKAKKLEVRMEKIN